VRSITPVDVPRGWTVEYRGDIIVTAPADDGKYYTATGTVKLLVSDDAERTIIKLLNLSCPPYTPPEKLGISFTQPPLFGWGGTKAVGFTTQGDAVAVKVLDVPAGWTVTQTGTVNAGTFTITAPAAESPGEAIVLVSDDAGNTAMRTLELAFVPTTLCPQCGYNGSAWVDCYVTTNAVSTGAPWSGNGYTYYEDARSNKDGRANTAAIASQGASAVQLCKDLGTGWYLPAYEELYAMGSGAANAASNNRAGAGILTDGYYWSSTELYQNGGRNSTSETSYQTLAVLVTTYGDLLNRSKTTNYYVRCAWRSDLPEPPVPLGITFTQPGTLITNSKAVPFTTQGNAITVKVLDVPTGWAVAVAKSGAAGTFTITAPAAESAGEAIVLVADAAGNTIMRTLELAYVPSPSMSVPFTLCPHCCYTGSAWVDCQVTTNAVSTSAPWSGNGETYYEGARSDKNGRANTAAIPSQGASAVQLCKDLGAGWYLPAYEELVNMGDGSSSTYPPLNNRAGAGILTGYHWSSTELYDNGGRHSDSLAVNQHRAMNVFMDGNLSGAPKNFNYPVRCAWRP
jgi:hypothetical protein